MAYENYKNNENMYTLYIRFKMPFLCQGNHMTAKTHLCKNGYKKVGTLLSELRTHSSEITGLC